MKRQRLIFHRLIQRDMDGILRYYREEASDSVADRFFDTFIATAAHATANPHYFHFDHQSSRYRRASIPNFPYHFLYRETSHGIRVLVLRHDSRHPSYGLSRK